MHSGAIGDIAMTNGSIEIVLNQYGDHTPAVTMYRHDPAETVVEDLTPDRAETLARLLIQAAAELGGAR